jgi:enoyl-CoA hydratase
MTETATKETQVMTSEDFSLDREEHVAILTLRRAHSLDIGGKQALTEILPSLRSNLGSIRAVILCATHPASWLVNVEELADMSPVEARIFSYRGHQLARAIADLPVPVIAAVDAPALGGGCELVLACDIALAGDRARFGQIEAMGGVMPAFGGTWRLEERVGYQRAMAMMVTGEVIDAETALRYGLVLEVHRSSDLLQAARQLAERIAGCSMQSVAAIKRVTRAGRGIPAAVRNQLEEEAFPSLFGVEQQARMHAFLQEQTDKRGQ